jgi:hypothetical protein
MSGLVIDHGNPWWTSPNVWAVPTSNPNEPSPGEPSPETGKQYYLKALVRNTETFRIDNAQINLYWANPSLTITRGNAHLVGSAFASVDGGQTAEALCLNPWSPTFVNQGHECLVAEVAHGIPSLSDVLDGQNDPQVAQHNLTVVMFQGASFHFAFEVCNPGRKEQTFVIHAEQADHEQFETAVRHFGNHLGPRTRGTVHELGFVKSPCPDMHALEGVVHPPLRHKLEPNGCTGYSLVGKLEGGAALVHITQAVEDHRIGGLSLLVVRREEEKGGQK